MRVVLSAFLAVAATAAVSCHAESTPAANTYSPTGLSLPFLSGGSTASSVAPHQSEEETGSSLEISIPLSQSSSLSKSDAPLMRDIEMLNDILNVIIQKENMNNYQLVEDFLEHGRERASMEDPDKPLEAMIEKAKSLSAEECLGVVRCISTALSLVGAAEVQHRLRAIRQYERECQADDTKWLPGPLYHTEDSVKGSIGAMVEGNQATKDQIYDKICNMSIEIVLTSHPTEVNRKSVLRKYRKISELLAYLERDDLLEYEKLTGVHDLQRIISSAWGMDEIRRNKPTVQQEAGGCMAVLETVLWQAVSSYKRKLDEQCLASLGKRLPLEVVPIKFASWVGGDRDGNPNVTPKVTREIVLHQRLRLCRLYLQDLSELESQLAISSKFSPAMLELARSIPENTTLHKIELYRRVIAYLRLRLVKTSEEIEDELAMYLQPKEVTFLRSHRLSSGGPNDRKAEIAGGDNEAALTSVTKAEDLLGPLRIMYESLSETGFQAVADGKLLDIITRLNVFGVSIPLDLRQESSRHTAAIDAITRSLGLGSYAEWSEEARLNFLSSELAGKRPLFRSEDLDRMDIDDKVRDTLETFKMASELEPENLGAYVISQCQTASDVLAVMLLQKQFGMTPKNRNMMRVVPLFETLDDLKNAPERLKTLFSIPAYVGAIKGKQEVMVGYSDSAKDAGRLAACWAQYLSQIQMVEVAQANSIELTFFHGKGGTVSRGGNPALYRAILSHPPNTINGRFRVTEQGEMVTQNFGSLQVAEHSLDIYTAAVMREAFTKHVEPKEEWKQEMERISEVSCSDYRHLVREEPRFVPYFRKATPELELASLNIGSRPSKRNPKGGIESLRAIPWTFAWTQTRAHLSAWLGVGAGLTANDQAELQTLQEMYSSWPWFRELIDLIAMILSKTDFSISKNYDTQLVDDADSLRLGDEVREKLVQTRQAILDVTQSENVSGIHIALQRASNKIRSPYIDPLNVIQAELLKRFRVLDGRDDLTPEEKEEKQTLNDALILSINAIAKGMRNSG